MGYAKQPPGQYSPKSLHKRLERNPKDVDALINLGIDLEEEGQTTQAEVLYERAIQAQPSCYLGYYFSGLALEGIGGKASADAEVNILRAINLNPSLQTDGNVQGFMSRHPRRMSGVPPKANELPSVTTEYLSSANRFLIGVSVGLLLAVPLVYFYRRK
ncbi:MAG TPA: tetratricopeptide repeat protein [Candidatus Acidoferrales bacterium]|nr:tetratricopeptide repeat protein [Candidatus Acidoferrales bacterium]